jgi:peptidoglycan/LPS O-acetylase OafA/YrhL
MSELRHRKFDGIQALRIVAALLVLFTHCTYYTWERLDRHFPVWQRGTRGVDVFFVISGFVMVYSGQKLIRQNEGWKIFAERRIVRIVPLYWLLTTLKICLMILAAGLALHAKLSIWTAIASYLFIPARNLDGKLEPLLAVGWTLNFEMLFYFIFTLALYLRSNIYQFVGIVLGLLSVGSVLRHPSSSPATFYLNSIVLEFFFGMLVARYCARDVYIPEKIAFCLFGCGCFFLLLPAFETPLPKVLISGIPAALMIWSAASLERFHESIPRAVLYLGEASYSIYLVHPFVCPLPPLLMSRAHVPRPVLAVAISVLLGLAMGCLVHEFIEVPLSRKLSYMWRERGQMLARTNQ